MRHVRFAIIVFALAPFILVPSAPAYAAGDEKPAAEMKAQKATATTSPLPCADLLRKLPDAPAETRVASYRDAMGKNCRPLPKAFWTAVESGKWADNQPLSTLDRSNLLSLAAERGYTEAETLSVKLLEEGRWSEGVDLSLEEGGNLIRGLKGALTPYRVHLLLDIYEQRTHEYVRFAVLQALSDSKLDEASLPALDALWNEKGSVQQIGYSNVMSQPEKAPNELLARLVRKLPSGNLLNWALRLANGHPSGPVAEAKKARGMQ